MKIARSLAEFEGFRAESVGNIGFVPTMGALHAGHLSLMRLTKQRADSVIVSIYVNPTQFAPNEDFDSYPRDIDSDLEKLEGLADLVFLPSEGDIYPSGPENLVRPTSFLAAQGLESDFRPHFFDGVASVVSRFFEIVKPDIAVFGEKDFQQLAVIREMVARDGPNIEIIGGEIARDEHGLALSSRNAYLSAGELDIARMLNQVIYNAAQELSSLRAQRSNLKAGLPRQPKGFLAMTNKDRGDDILQEAEKMLLTAGFDTVDYVTYKPEWDRVLAAAWLGQTRLIDNCAIKAC